MLIFEYVPGAKTALKANIFMSFKQHIKIPLYTKCHSLGAENPALRASGTNIQIFYQHKH